MKKNFLFISMFFFLIFFAFGVFGSDKVSLLKIEGPEVNGCGLTWFVAKENFKLPFKKRGKNFFNLLDMLEIELLKFLSYVKNKHKKFEVGQNIWLKSLIKKHPKASLDSFQAPKSGSDLSYFLTNPVALSFICTEFNCYKNLEKNTYVAWNVLFNMIKKRKLKYYSDKRKDFFLHLFNNYKDVVKILNYYIENEEEFRFIEIFTPIVTGKLYLKMPKFLKFVQNFFPNKNHKKIKLSKDEKRLFKDPVRTYADPAPVKIYELAKPAGNPNIFKLIDLKVVCKH